MEILRYIYVIAAVVFLFGAAVFVHEFGHYWVARRRGMKVEAFAIGFGPKLFGWTKDGIVYSWNLIPAGGYVKLPQMLTSSTLEGEQSTPAEQLPPATPLTRILVAFAGPFMNVVFAFVIATIIYFAGLPVPINPSIIGYVQPDSPEARLGIQEGDRIVAVNGTPVDSWEDVQQATIFARTNVVPVQVEHQGATNTYNLTTVISESIGLKMLNLDPRDHPVLTDIKSGSAAEKAGLKAKDEVLSFGQAPVFSPDHFITLIQSRAGQPTEIVVRRDNKNVTNSVTPILDASTGKGRIGAGVTGNSTLTYRLEKPGPNPWTQVSDVFNKTVGTFSALLHSKQTGVGPKDLSGPIGILSILAAQVNTDYRLALSFLVLLNINLAMINLLPIPVLDGGHILMALIESVRRRPVNVRLVEYVTTVFAVLLISFILYVSFADIKRFPMFKSMFGRDIHIEVPSNASGGPVTSP